MSELDLPPWGRMDDASLDLVRRHPVPTEWRNGIGDTAGWSAWRDSVLDEIADALWPRYDVATGEWRGAAAQSALALTDADFELMRELAACMGETVSGRFATPVTHGELFPAEDEGMPGATYEVYDPLLPGDLRAVLSELVRTGLITKQASLTQQLKSVLQRPRAYQVALLQGRAGFGHTMALSGSTPSMVSGHCLQGMMAGCHLREVLGQRGDVSPQSLAALGQFMVDIGDRRVFAGVHYPSDNLASWYVSLRLLPHVFEAASVQRIARFLWSSILEKSPVYKAIAKHAVANGSSPYKAMLARIDVQLQRLLPDAAQEGNAEETEGD